MKSLGVEKFWKAYRALPPAVKVAARKAYQKFLKNLPLNNSSRASLEAALISHHIGDVASAQSLFQKAYATNHKGFQGHVAELARRVGYTLV